jgi:hypothetical protein
VREIEDDAKRLQIMARIERYNEKYRQATAVIYGWAKAISVARSTWET